MTNNTSHSAPSLGNRLKLAREALRFEQKDVASQLRLNEKYIQMMESDHYPEDLSPTFIRGYLRSYGRLLQIPSDEMEQAIDQLKPGTHKVFTAGLSKTYAPISNDLPKTRFSTYLTLLVLAGFIGIWLYSYSTPNQRVLAKIQLDVSPATPAPATPVVAEQQKIKPEIIESEPVLAQAAPAINNTITKAAKPIPKVHRPEPDDEPDDDNETE